jgi:DNA repair exonuclease SbcCD ATPase subunit
MKIDFQTLKIEGFAGIVGYEVFKLDSPGLNVITGPNGARKTTRVSALSWVLYGYTLKKGSSVETWEHKQPEGYQGTKVELSFIRSKRRYKVIRCHLYQGKVKGVKGNKRLFILDENGDHLFPELKDKRDLQRALEELVGMSYTVFINSIIFPQKVTRFIEARGAERKKILEESFKATWVNRAQDLGRRKLKDIQGEIAPLEAQLKEAEDSLDNLQEMLETIKETRDEFYQQKEEDLKAVNKSIKEQRALLKFKPKSPDAIVKQLNTRRAELETLKEKRMDKGELKTLRDERAEALGDLRILRKDINKINASLDSVTQVCPECNQVIKDWEKHKVELNKTLISKTNSLEVTKKIYEEKDTKVDNEDALEVDIELLGNDVDVLQRDLDKIIEYNSEVEAANSRLSDLEKEKERIEKRELKDNSGPIKQKISNQEKKIVSITHKLKKLKRSERNTEWVIKNPLGSNGLSMFLFDKLLALVNQELNTLESYTQVGVELVIEGDRRKDVEAIIYRDGYPVPFQDLSGGEGALVNIMISLAIGNIVTLDHSVNIRIFDESFESISKENVDVVGSMIAGINPNVSTFVITHLEHFNPSGANSIMLVKDE